jgi:hypothetical protein
MPPLWTKSQATKAKTTMQEWNHPCLQSSGSRVEILCGLRMREQVSVQSGQGPAARPPS